MFNLASVLRDKLLANQTKDDFQAVFKSKVLSVKNLDEITRKSYPKLDYFVAFSSSASGLGNHGQTNYGMANSAVEQICRKRKLEGFAALVIQYGPIGQVGLHENGDIDVSVSKCLIHAFQ